MVAAPGLAGGWDSLVMSSEAETSSREVSPGLCHGLFDPFDFAQGKTFVRNDVYWRARNETGAQGPHRRRNFAAWSG